MTTPEQPGLLGILPGSGPQEGSAGGRAASRRDAAAGSSSSASAFGAIPERCCLVTNHLNLLYMLAAGLVLPRSGFGEKYYRDTLESCPGWIPLFTGRPGRAAVDHSIAEAAHLKPCRVVVSLRDCAGPVMVPVAGGVEKRRWPHEVGGAPLIFVPAPLPASAVEEVRFGSLDDAKACRADASDYGNVPLADFETRADRKRPGLAAGPPWPPPHVPPERAAPLGAAQAAGGMLAMLRLLANRDRGETLEGGEPLGLAACRAAFDPVEDVAPGLSATVAAELTAWMRTGLSFAPPGAALPGIDGGGARRLFWGAVDTLAARAGVAGVDEANARLLDYLDRASTDLDGPLRKHVVELRETLDSLTGLADVTVSDLFDRFTTPFPRAMSLLFLRSTCADLLAFEHEALDAEDRLAAALLFGARAGWLALPLSLRGGKADSAAVSHRMAALSHRLADTGFELGPAPARPRPLAELFAGEWDARRRKAAVELARRQKWTDCLRTRVKLGAGEYALKVTRTGTEIVFPGEAGAIETEADRPRFAARLAAASIDPEHEAAVAGMLEDGGATAPRGRRRRDDRQRAGDRRAGG